MKLSIVITYYNRRKQLLNTLYSIEASLSSKSFDTEIIIVDDESCETINDIKDIFDLNINFIRRSGKDRIDPVIPFNMGFNAVTGDVILINCAECYHFGNIINYIYNHFTDGQYMSFSTYSISWDLYNQIRINKNESNIDKIINPTHPLPEQWKDLDTGWYSHPEYNNSLMPFCAAISTRNMERLSGFDERFANATGWADHDFIVRVNNLKLKTSLIEKPFCVHQPHEATNYKGSLNNELFVQLQNIEPNRIKSPFNKVYNR
jgi:glycosyltransferase involved in cell wall biosynthesis